MEAEQTGEHANGPRWVSGEVQQRYARVLSVGGRIGLAVLAISFALYVSGMVAPAVPIERLPEYWGLPVQQYLARVNAEFLHLEHPPTRWAWVPLAGNGEFLNFVGIALLASVTIACCLSIVPKLYRQGRVLFTVIAALQALILILAASGLLNAGH